MARRELAEGGEEMTPILITIYSSIYLTLFFMCLKEVYEHRKKR